MKAYSPTTARSRFLGKRTFLSILVHNMSALDSDKWLDDINTRHFIKIMTNRFVVAASGVLFILFPVEYL